MNWKDFLLIACSALLGLSGTLLANEQPYKVFAKAIEHEYFALRIQESLCSRTPAFDNRTIWTCRLTKVDRGVAVNGIADWEGKYFVSGRRYRLKSAKLDGSKNVIELKVWGEQFTRGLLEDEIRLEISDASQQDPHSLEYLFFGIFVRRDEAIKDYEAKINHELVERYLDPEPQLFVLPQETRDKLLNVIHMMGFPAQPKLEHVGQDLYIPANLIADTSVYNDIRVSKNQRLATTIEKQLRNVRIFAEHAIGLPVVKGIRFEWSDFHKDFLQESSFPTEEKLEMLVPLQAIAEFVGGNLSAFELVQKSTLRTDGMKVTLITYDPIGSQ
jgi:hypothetical protein